MPEYLSVDLETYSPYDIKKCGAFHYAEDVEILLFGYAFNDEPVEVIAFPTINEAMPQDIEYMLSSPEVIKTAFNAMFEFTVLSKFFKGLSIGQWQCSALQCRYLGLPGDLAGASKVLWPDQQDKQKMSEGKALINYFCKPCKPTKANGGRTRNLPEHAPEKWAKFVEYNRQDVEVERALKNRLGVFPVPETEQKYWQIDYKINQRGVLVDPVLVRQAILMNGQQSTILTDEAKELTGLENPNSVAQLKPWLETEIGQPIESLNKETLPDLLTAAPNETVRRVVQLRQLLSKTSVKKYQALEYATCLDGRLRGVLQFYGASRTGRWAGRIFQPQNLPRISMGEKELDIMREWVKEGKFDNAEVLGPDNTLSQLIRTTLLAKPGYKLIVCDLSAIEARMLAWLAGEQWVLDLFQESGKIYEATAARMFKVPMESIGKHSTERAKGKVATLACIAEGQPVLTDKGLVPIECVTKDMRVWDGLSWVFHGGVIYKGRKKVITYDGLTATEDHLVWVTGKSRPVRFKDAAASGAYLLHTGNKGSVLWECKDHIRRKALAKKRMAQSDGTSPVPGLWSNKLGLFRKLNAGYFKRLPKLLATKTDTSVVGQTLDRSKAAVRKPERRRILKLWREGNMFQLQQRNCRRVISDTIFRTATTFSGDRPNKQRRKLRTREYTICNATAECGESSELTNLFLEPSRMALCSNCCKPETCRGSHKSRYYSRCKKSCSGEKKELVADQGTARVYDIVDAGPQHRFTVSGVLVHNCGYGGGKGALAAFGADKMGMTEEEMQDTVDQWRAANTQIVKFWWNIGKAAMATVKDHLPRRVRTISFSWQKGILFMQLPSGRRLAYNKPRIVKGRFDRDVIEFEGQDQTTGKWSNIQTFGPKIVENCTQAASRDILAEAVAECERQGIAVVLHVHDEIVCEVPEDFDKQILFDIMTTQPVWAKGLPLNAEAQEAKYYCK